MEALDRDDVEVLDLDDEHGPDPFSPERLVGVAVLGAVSSLLIYYMFNQLDPERRESIKDGIMATVKNQVRRWGEA